MSKKKKKSGRAFPIILVLIIAGVAGSNFVGPSKGWITKFTNDNEEITDSEVVLQETSEVEDNSSKNKQVTPDIEKKSPKKDTTKNSSQVSEIEKMHKDFMNEYLSKTKKPEIGKRYKVKTLTNSLRDGELEKVDDYKIYLIKVKPYNAKTSIHYSQLPAKARKFFFSEKAANSYANTKLEEYLKSQNKIKEATQETVASTTSSSKTITSRSFTKFDPTVASSPKRLSHAAMEVKNYLANQSRISKMRDGIEYAEIDKCHAKQQGRAAVFYMYVPTSFVKTSQEFRFQVIDGVRRFWALRCMSNAVSVASNAYLCVVYKDKIIGGSNLKDAEDTWSK